MTERLVVDPVTRIEGHLRIEARMDGERIAEAYSSGTMVRGLELILRGRDPREAWAFAQRICGVCTLVHGIASVRAVEAALKGAIPPNAQLIRNLMIAAQHVHDHVMHFYHLHALDWVDVASALRADPKAAAALAQRQGQWPLDSIGHFTDVQKRLHDLLKSGQPGLFANGYWGHPAYKLPREINLIALVHDLDALAWQREIVKLHTLFGGKNPHPNLVVGGVASPIDLDSDTAINARKLAQVQDLIQQMREFVTQVYVPDVLSIASYYKDWGERGEGLGNFMSYGDLPARGAEDPASFLLPRGVILGRDLRKVHELDLDARDQIEEYVAHSWYRYQDGNAQGLHPYAGETALDYEGCGGVPPPYQQLRVDDGYSFIKSPRWRGHVVEVGPLARVLLLHATGHRQTRELVKMALRRLDLSSQALFSTLGRTLARALETQILVDAMQTWYDDLIANIKAGETKTCNQDLWDPVNWPARCWGVGYMEAPRGALGHWIDIENGKIANYQAVVPTTWNAGPRDHQGQPGAYEAALQDRHQLHDPARPVEILRTVHSFDPCIACAVHLVDPQGAGQVRIRVQ
ncbi:hydrogenase 2 large subunit [Thiocystis minor]|uniref:nickel-dependent hydrogenase large subunit n=1 Tax=Thiocystis minor TaxID=61597 RepID=UPI001912D572|nr:nickel-dependent hydrogenase large subunit [Thiocystis minor]MBK5963145.1 hydrogenase 2 large subunit [Thiocystis minor]